MRESECENDAKKKVEIARMICEFTEDRDAWGWVGLVKYISLLLVSFLDFYHMGWF